MLAGLVVLGVLCAGLAASTAFLWSSRRKLTTTITALTAERDEHETQATAALARADSAEAARLTADADALVATRRADEAFKRAVSAEAGAAAADARAKLAEGRASEADRSATAAKREAQDALRRAEQESEQREAAVEQREAAEVAQRAADSAALMARAEAEAALERAAGAEAEQAQLVQLLHPDGSWALDHLRLDRLWRDRLSLPGEDGSPLAALEDPTQVQSEALRLAVHVLTEASREETGVVIDLDWQLDQPVPPALASAVVRLAEELVAAARLSDGGQLDVLIQDDAVVLRLATDPPIELPEALAAAVQRFEWSFTRTGDVIDARIPLALAAPPNPS